MPPHVDALHTIYSYVPQTALKLKRSAESVKPEAHLPGLLILYIYK